MSIPPEPTPAPLIKRAATALRDLSRWLIGESSPASKNRTIGIAAAATLIVAIVLVVVAVATSTNSTTSTAPDARARVSQHGHSAPKKVQLPFVAKTPRSALVKTPPAAIAHDCSHDVGAALRKWLWSLPHGTAKRPIVVNFPQGACYTVNEALYLRGLTHITINGHGAEFREDDPQVTTIGPLPVDHPYCGSTIDEQSGTSMSAIPIMWWFEGGCDITLTNMEIVGPNRSGVVGSETDSGIQLSGVQRTTIENVTERDVDGDFVTVTGLHEGSPEDGGGIAIFPSRYVAIKNNIFARSGRQGITPQYVDHLTVTGNTFSGVAFTDIDLEADEQGGCSCNVTVDDNNFVGPLAYLVAGLTGLSIQHFAFTDNTLTAGAQMKVQFAPQLPSSGIVIAGNKGQTASTWPWPSIGIGYSVDGDGVGSVSNVVIRDNTIPAPKDGRTFVLAGAQASQVHVILNEIAGLAPSGLLLNHGASSNGTCGNTAGPNGPALDHPC